MGLFKRRAETKQEIDTLRDELRSLRQRLEAADAAKQRIAERLGHLDAEHTKLTAHVGTVESKVGSVEHRVASVAESFVPSNDAQAITALDARMDEVREILAVQQSQIADIALVATDSAERTQIALEALGSSVPDDTGQSDDAHAEVARLAERIASVDARLHQVSQELTNQLTELGTDLDQASTAADADELVARVTRQLDDLTGGQTRLANEQARYAIQFREDLAELADRLRRPRSNP